MDARIKMLINKLVGITMTDTPSPTINEPGRSATSNGCQELTFQLKKNNIVHIMKYKSTTEQFQQVRSKRNKKVETRFKSNSTEQKNNNKQF